MSLHLITGKQGAVHITADNDRHRNAMIMGSGLIVRDELNNLSASVLTNNSVEIDTGMGFVDGGQFELTASETVTIENGASGYYRNDLICLRYQLSETDGTESLTLVVIKGEASDTSATDPEYNTGSILDGDTIVDFPLYRISLSGLNIVDSKAIALFTVVDDTMATIKKTLNNIVLNTLYPVGSIYLETTNTNPSSKLGGTWVAYGSSDSYLRLGGNGSGGQNSISYTPSGKNTGGSVSSHTLSTSEIPSHTHGLNGHTHGVSAITSLTTGISGSHQHQQRRSTTGIGNTGTTYSGQLLVDYGASEYSSSLSMDANGDHQHSFSVPAHTTQGNSGNTTSTGGTGGHDHGFTNPTFTGNTATLTTEPKYVAVYAWKRTA